MTMQPCSVAKFLAAVLEVPLEDGYKAAGLVCCPICEKAGTKPEYYPYCGLQHQRKGLGLGRNGREDIQMTCEGCNRIFPRPLSTIINQARLRDRRGQTGDYHVFCSNHCQGVLLGALPREGRKKGSGRTRKHDYEAIWQRHLDTGEGATALARHFQIPVPSADSILTKLRKAALAKPPNPC